SIGTYLQSVLKSIGYDASVKALSQNIQFTYIQNTNNKVQISVSQWYQDYPAPSDFLNVLLGCGTFHPGSDNSPNIAGFCDKTIQDKMNAALALSVTDPAAANKEWAVIDRMMADQAPVAVLFTPKYIDFLSKRVKNYVFNAQYYWGQTSSWIQ
ncbi:MAG TPA: ABC transporter substrate-binding protein, partial [Verrucomicrobiae bacterium]|nr:ABC transporter substrate-binding protein [Verrucomicrobiae bacterium]